MTAIAHFAQFLAFALGLVAIYIGVSSNRNANSKVLKIYISIIILTNLIILIHVFEAFFKIVFVPEVYDKFYRPLFWYMIIPASGIRFWIANRYFKFYKIVDEKSFNSLYNHIAILFYVLFIAVSFLIDTIFSPEKVECRIFEYIYLLIPHFVLSLSIAMLAIKIIQKKNNTHAINKEFALLLSVFFLFYSFGLFFLRFIQIPGHRISEHTQMAGIGLIAIIFNLFNIFFIKKIFLPKRLDITQISMEKIYTQNGITKREQEIVELICEGKTNKEIAELLFITPVTVRDHLSHIYKKTRVKNRTQLASLFKF